MKFEITKQQILELNNNSEKLKEWFPEVFENKPEAGKWYISSLGNLVFYEDKEELYGIIGRSWTENAISKKDIENNFAKWKKATEEEVFEALKNEAIKRGFVEGAFYQWINCPIRKIYGNEFTFDDFVFRTNGFTLLNSDGKWATIIETITKEEAEKLLNKKIID